MILLNSTINDIVKPYHHLDLPALIDERQPRNIKTSSLTKQSLL